MLNYAILIDGGFAKRKLGSAKMPAEAKNFSIMIEQIMTHEALRAHRLHRVYYYDATPLTSSEKNPLSGETVNFGATAVVTSARKLFDDLARLPFVALRLGDLSFNGWHVRPKALRREAGDALEITGKDLAPQIQQKGVDMRIGMDIAALTLKKQVQIIVLVSGDSDFVPAMKFARREGCQLFLCALGHHIKPSMLEHSDLLLSFD